MRLNLDMEKFPSMGVALKYHFLDRLFQRAHVRQTTFGRLGMPGAGNFVSGQKWCAQNTNGSFIYIYSICMCDLYIHIVILYI